MTTHSELMPIAADRAAPRETGAPRTTAAGIGSTLPARLVMTIALAAIVTGASVIAGWYFRLPGLSRLHPALGTMGPQTALCLMLTGMSLWGLGLGRGRWTRGIALSISAAVVAMAVLTLGVTLYGWTLDINQGLWNAVGQMFPGPMPVATALCFLCVGLALIFLEVEVSGIVVAEVLAFCGALIAILALIAYAYGFVSLVTVVARRPLAFHTVVLLLSLSAGVFLARPHRGVARLASRDSVTRMVMRLLLPAAVVMPVLLGWGATELQRIGVLMPQLTLAYYTLAIIVVFSLFIILTAGLLDRSEGQRQQAQQEVRTLNMELQQRVIERTAELEHLNKELEAFSYSVSHDLRAPLRHIAGFATILHEGAGPSLDDQNRQHLQRIILAAQRMGHLIDDLLSFSRMGRTALTARRVNLHEIVVDARREVLAQPGPAARHIEWRIDAIPDVYGDPAMLRLAVLNLLANAVKYSSPRDRAEIDVGVPSGVPETSNDVTVFVRDNGVGFDMRYVGKLFGVFQRLHRADEFEGTGIGLANVKRIIGRHGGRVWAEGEIGRGATFYFSLPRARAVHDHHASKDSAR